MQQLDANQRGLQSCCGAPHHDWRLNLLSFSWLSLPLRELYWWVTSCPSISKDRTTSTDSLVECWNEVQISTQVFWISSLTQKILNCVEMWKVMEIERWYTLRLLVWIFKKYPLTQPSYLGLYVSTLCKSPEIWQGKIGLQFFDWG